MQHHLNGYDTTTTVRTCERTVSLWSYLSPIWSAWAWFRSWLWALGTSPARGAGTTTRALFGDTVLTAVQASPSSFHKQVRSGRSSTALKMKQSEKVYYVTLSSQMFNRYLKRFLIACWIRSTAPPSRQSSIRLLARDNWHSPRP